MSEFISYTYLNEDNEEVYALLGADLVENLGVIVDGVDLSYAEHKRLQSQVRQTIAQAITEYDPHATKPADRRVQGGPQGNFGVSVRGLGLPDEVTKHVELRVQQELLGRIADKTASLRAHPRDPVPPGMTSCVRPLPAVPILAIDPADFEARFRNIPRGEKRTIYIFSGPSTGVHNLEILFVEIYPVPEYPLTGTRIFLRNNLWSELKRNREDEWYNRGLRIWRCSGADPRRPDILEPLTEPFSTTVAPGEGSVPRWGWDASVDAGSFYKPGHEPAGGVRVRSADTVAISGNVDDRVLACWDLFQFWPLHGGRDVVYQWRKDYRIP